MNERQLLVRRLQQDLIGPQRTDEELTTGRPSDIYLTGILWPPRQRLGDEEAEKLDSAGAGGSGEEETEGPGEEVPLSGQQRPCSAGLSFAVAGDGQDTVSVQLTFALYAPEEQEHRLTPGSSGSEQFTSPFSWKRTEIKAQWDSLQLPNRDYVRKPVLATGLPGGVELYVRSTNAGTCRLVTIIVINGMKPEESDRDVIEKHTMFQVSLSVRPAGATHLVPKPQLIRGRDEEELAGALLFRECPMFAVGHTCSASWLVDESHASNASLICTDWLPEAEVPRVSAAGHEDFAPLSARKDLRCLEAAWLAAAAPGELKEALELLVACYSRWIDRQDQRIDSLAVHLRDQGRRHVRECRSVRDRMAAAVTLILRDSNLLESFRLANLAMQRQHAWNPARRAGGPLLWRPFQLAFVLLAGPSSCVAESPDRPFFDLLWFPTGGGKTEAYLALIAMVAFYRRLSSQSAEGRAGVAAIMRYTLRLLTTQQFVRAAALILACESFRRGHGISAELVKRLGTRPFSIGLWLGGDATPNTFEVAQRSLRGDSADSSPEQLLSCPCCQSRIRWTANDAAKRIEARCPNTSCMLAGDLLPVWTVDSDVYVQRPTLLIGTIDKFAQLPRREEVRTLFGMGTDDAPDLVIQDELHLISGPLGTVAALYEVAFDWLVCRGSHRPKVIGSTATIRRAREQARALFNRETVQFPPPGLDHLDSGFAVRDQSMPGRVYVGVTTAGRSAKFSLQAVAGALLQAASGVIPDPVRRDPYSTLLAYFNSLRELGGALVLMQDDVSDSLRQYAARWGEAPRDAGNIEELTSRRTQEEVRDMLDKLAVPASGDGSIDVVLATNMVSVGVDVPRLALMVMNGQPKTRSEYIQATSRVGRDAAPGLIVSVLSAAKPRDRSHYETFISWHTTLYREVEATSVTPFASRARDRALKAVLVSMARHRIATLYTSPTALSPGAPEIAAVVNEIVDRAARIDPGESDVRQELEAALLQWEARSPSIYWNDAKPKSSLLQSAERAATLRSMGRSIGSPWPTMNNMRSVEPSVPFRLAEALVRRDMPGRGQ